MNKLTLLKFAGVLLLVLFVALIVLGLLLSNDALLVWGLILFSVVSGLLTSYFILTHT